MGSKQLKGNIMTQSIKAAMAKSIGSIKRNPKTANVVFRADTKLVEGVQCLAQVRDFPPMVIDETS